MRRAFQDRAPRAQLVENGGMETVPIATPRQQLAIGGLGVSDFSDPAYRSNKRRV